MTVLLGVDTGGTFTDFVVYHTDTGRLLTHKVLSTPHNPSAAILQGIEELGLQPRFTLVHGSTVATNAALERKGVKVAYITSKGFADVLSIGRQARSDLYDLQHQPQPEPVPADLCLEVEARGDAGGQCASLSDAQIQALKQELSRMAPRSVAINLLFSFLNDKAEKQLEQVLQRDYYVSRSSFVLPVYKEYERGIATWLNSYLGPLMQGYLQNLQRNLPDSALSIMQSSAGTLAADQAGKRAVNLLLSGPAGGLRAVQYIQAQKKTGPLLTFDMGGTSSDVAYVDGELRLSDESFIGGFPVALPMVDMHTIGAGGGSIAYVDAGGMLRVGPESAGADPGPVCYGRGGRQLTVTDANVLLGHLPQSIALGGTLSLDLNSLNLVAATMAAELSMDVQQLAQGIIDIANEHMVAALRVISVQRGIDARDCSLFGFGGASGLHVCALAEALNMRKIIMPVHSGILSALGMLVAPAGRQLTQGINRCMDEIDDTFIGAQFAELEAQGIEELLGEGIAEKDITIGRRLNMRYAGQSYTLDEAWSSCAKSVTAFHQKHGKIYGYGFSLPVELVSIQSELRGPVPEIRLPAMVQQGEPEQGSTLYWRHNMSCGVSYAGPAIIMDKSATVFVAPGWLASRDETGHLELTR